jgi:glycosyltransferase involved in cell wall biosynthesis
MTFSAVIPNFNHGSRLPRAVSALMAQTPPPEEIIVIDDASVDDSIAVIKRLQQRFPCIRLIQHEQNRGVIAGLNEGLATATKDFIYFAAADDYAFPALFATASAAFASHSDIAFFCGRVVLVDPDGNILGVRPFMARDSGALTPASVRAAARVSDNWAVGPSVIYRRQRLVDAGGFDATVGAFTDGLIVRRLAFESGFYYSSAIVAAWERYPESYSARTAFSAIESARMIDKALAMVRANFPADIREDYAEMLGRRFRFNMAQLWLTLNNGPVNADGMADVLQFDGFNRAVLRWCARLPLPRLAVRAWMTLVLRPFSIGAILAGSYRCLKAKTEMPAVAEQIAAARTQTV